MTKRIITTVGTSLFTNYMDKDRVVRDYSELSREYRAIDTQYKNLEKSDHSQRQNSKYDSDIRYLKETIEYLWFPFAKEISCAELQTLYAIADENKNVEYEVYLLATDTVLSIVACELIKSWLDQGNIKSIKKCVFHSDANAPDTTVVKGLQVEYAHKFETEGFSNLLKIIKKFSVKDQTLFNISGGYKALIPYLTLFAQLEEIPLKYMYEDSEDLVTVGNLPFGFDWAVAERYYLLLQDGKDFIANNQQKDDLDAQNIIQDCTDMGLLGKRGTITELGILFQNYVKDQLAHGKNTLGFLMEYKLMEYFQLLDETTKRGKISRSIMIEVFPPDAENLPKGNEIDLLIEHQSFNIYNELLEAGRRETARPESKSYTTVEVKPLMGANEVQFEAFLRRISHHWPDALPSEIRLVVYSFLPEGFAKKKFEQSDKWQKYARLVKEILGETPFTIQHVNIDIAFKKHNILEHLMKNPIQRKHFIASKTFINGIQKPS